MSPDFSFLHASAFYQLTAILVMAAIFGLAGLALRQPMIVSFIIVGVLSGPSMLGIVQTPENIDVLAELGITVLLFLVGLKLDLKLIRTLGVVSLATGLGQVVFTSLIGFGLGLVLGLDPITSAYVAVALTFSSTIIIVKLLSDKREVDSLHGRIALGFLIVQDLVVVVAMMALSSFGIGAEADAAEGGWYPIARIVLSGALMVVVIAAFIRYLAVPLVGIIARSSELIVIFAIAWASLLAAASEFAGFSMELGGLLAGVSLASTPLRESIVARMAPLRDFLLLFFFIALGLKLDLNLLGAQVSPAIVFSVFVLIGNPLIVVIIMGLMGYRKRTGFLAGLTVAQISEFSLIFTAMGVSLGHIGEDALALVTLVGLITIATSVYMITYSHTLYRCLEPVLGMFERKVAIREQETERQLAGKPRKYDVLLFGLGRYGAAIAENLRQADMNVLGVDFNPDEVKRWRDKGLEAIYGDAADQEFLGMLPLTGVNWVISAMPQHELGLTHEDPRLALIAGLRREGYKGRIAVSSHHAEEADYLRQKGADVVFLPFYEAADRVVRQISDIT